MRHRICGSGLAVAVLLAAMPGSAAAQDATRVAQDSLRDTTAVAPAPAAGDTSAADTIRGAGYDRLR